MTIHEATDQRKSLLEHCKTMRESGEIWARDVEALDIAIAALCGPTREQVVDLQGEWLFSILVSQKEANDPRRQRSNDGRGRGDLHAEIRGANKMARLIDGEKLKNEAESAFHGALGITVTGAVHEIIDRQPTIDPESLRPHGKWVKEPFSSRCVCTNCKSVFPEWIRVYNYCPLCGARMMEEEAAKFIQAFGEMMKNET